MELLMASRHADGSLLRHVSHAPMMRRIVLSGTGRQLRALVSSDGRSWCAAPVNENSNYRKACRTATDEGSRTIASRVLSIS